MGKRMFDVGELAWPEEAPFHTPVFVVTHTKRDPWERPGGTTFHFVNDGIESALDQAREAAGDRDVRIAGGAETIQEYLDSGLIDEFSITLAPVLFGTGIRLFDRVDPDRLALDQARTGRLDPGDPPDLHRRETLARVPAACGASNALCDPVVELIDVELELVDSHDHARAEDPPGPGAVLRLVDLDARLVRVEDDVRAEGGEADVSGRLLAAVAQGGRRREHLDDDDRVDLVQIVSRRATMNKGIGVVGVAVDDELAIVGEDRAACLA